MPVLVSADPSADDLLLELSDPGRVEGHIRFVGERPPVVVVIAWPVVAGLETQVAAEVVVRPDGSFAFERLAAGPHVIAVTAARGESRVGTETHRVNVRAGQSIRLEPELQLEGAELAVEVVGDGGEVPVAQIFLFRGAHELATVGDVNRAVVYATGALGEMGWARHGRPAILYAVPEGRHTLCGIPLPGDLKDPELRELIHPRRFDWPVHCQPLEVERGTAQLRLELELPAPAPLSSVARP